MNLKIRDTSVDLDGITESQYHQIREFLSHELAPQRQVRTGIVNAFLFAVRMCPSANPSDIWHHVIYREFLKIRAEIGEDPGQSWKRAGGEALEEVFAEYYRPLLEPHGVRMRALISRPAKRKALADMGLLGDVGDSKLDTVLEGRLDEDWKTFGGAHVKASLAERVSDDQGASEKMMRKGFLSPLLTMDAKSFPAPHGDFVNRGELGSPGKPSEKRRYIEEKGQFDNCYSFNARTVPSRPSVKPGRRVYTLSMQGREDQFVRDIVAAWQRFRQRG